MLVTAKGKKIVYVSPSLCTPPFVEEGPGIKADSRLCLVEDDSSRTGYTQMYLANRNILKVKEDEQHQQG